MSPSLLRTRWAAIGAAIAITLGGGGLGIVQAVQSTGERATYAAIAPCRLMDTRAASPVPGRHTPIGPGEVHTQNAHGNNGECTSIPADATALTLNVTALDATSPTYLTFWPADLPQPNASHLNPTTGQAPTPNAVNVDIAPTGQFKIFNERGTVNVIVDITGYYVDHNHDDRYPRTDNAKIAYAWMCHSVSTIDVTMDVTTCGGGGQQYAFNPTGGAITSTRFAVGRYDVVFHGLSMSGGNVQVTAYSQTAGNTDWCKIASWGASVARVNCFTIAGAPVDTQFTVTMMD